MAHAKNGFCIGYILKKKNSECNIEVTAFADTSLQVFRPWKKMQFPVNCGIQLPPDQALTSAERY